MAGAVPWRHRELTAVDGVSFRLRRGATMAVAGESGSGKSTLARMVLGLLEPTSGSVTFDGTDVADHGPRPGVRIPPAGAPVFQNPYSSLDPMYSVFRLIEEPLRIHRVGDRGQRRRAVRELLDEVALPSAVLGRRPRELSGGQRQRVAIARALALRPDVLVCDEAVSALDVIVQAQILELLADLQARLGLTYLFISHDLAVIRQIADDVLVMRAGRMVEARDPSRTCSQRRVTITPGAAGRDAAIPRGRVAAVTADPLAPLMELPGVAEASGPGPRRAGPGAPAPRQPAWLAGDRRRGGVAGGARVVGAGRRVRCNSTRTRPQRSGVRRCAAGRPGAGRRRGPPWSGLAAGAAAGAGAVALAGRGRPGRRRPTGPPAADPGGLGATGPDVTAGDRCVDGACADPGRGGARRTPTRGN